MTEMLSSWISYQYSFTGTTGTAAGEEQHLAYVFTPCGNLKTKKKGYCHIRILEEIILPSWSAFIYDEFRTLKPQIYLSRLVNISTCLENEK